VSRYISPYGNRMQIGTLKRIELENYFKNLCLEEIVNELINLLKL
jgi:hypothetical protein